MDRGVWALVLMLVMLPFASKQATRMWQGRVPGGSESRAAPLAILGGWPFFGFALVVVLSDGTLRLVFAFMWIVVMVAMCVLLPSVHFFGKPRSLVPPHLRDDVRA